MLATGFMLLCCCYSLDSLGRAAVLKRTVELCKRTRHCFRCGAFNGNVRRGGHQNLVHRVYM